MRIQRLICLLFLLALLSTQALAQNRPGNGKWWQRKDHPNSKSEKEGVSEGPVIAIEENEESLIDRLSSDLLNQLRADWKICYSPEAVLPLDLDEAYTSLKAIADLSDHKSQVQPGTASCSQTVACESQKNSKISCFTKNAETVKVMSDIKSEKKFGKRKHHQLKNLIDLLEAHKGQ